jgi:flagellar biosynthesis protein FliQ
VVILIVVALTGPFIGAEIYGFTSQVYSRIESGF